MNGTLVAPLTLTYICVTAFMLYRAWPNFIYSISLPITEWKMYRREYVQLNRMYRTMLSLARPLGMSGYANIGIRCNLASVQLQLGELEEAEDIYRSCLALLDKQTPNLRFQSSHNLYRLFVKCGVAITLCHQEKYLEAELLLAEVFDSINAKTFAADLYEGYAYYLLGHVHMGLKDKSAADDVLKGLNLMRKAKTVQSFREHTRSQMINACNLALALIYIESGNVAEANIYYDKFFAELEEGRSTISPLGVKDLNAIAKCYLDLDDYGRAEKILQLCYFLMIPTPFTPVAKQTVNLYETLLLRTGRDGEIADLKC